MTKNEVFQWSLKHGFERKGFCVYRRDKEGNKEEYIRIKLLPLSIVLEVQTQTKEGPVWVKAKTAFYKDLWLNDNDGLVGLKSGKERRKISKFKKEATNGNNG